MSNLTMFVHVLAAIVLMGPVVVFVSASPRAIRKGSDRLGALRWIHRSTKIYGWATLLVAATGILAGAASDDHKMSEWWMSVSAGLFVVVFVLLLMIMRQQDTAIEWIERGDNAAPYAARIAMYGGIASLLVAAIVGLMVWKPGSH